MLKVGITQGDPNGIGPEVIIKALAPEGMTELMTPVVFANKGLILATMQQLKGENFRFNPVESAADAKDGKINLVNVGSRPIKPDYGNPSQEGGMSAYQALEEAVKALEEGDIDLLVTAPINKAAIQNVDFRFPGHTEYLEQRLAHAADEEDSENDSLEERADNDSDEEHSPADGAAISEEEADGESSSSDEDSDEDSESDDAYSENLFGSLKPKAQMILFNDDLRVALLTTHLPLSEVASSVSRESIIEAVRRLDITLRSDFGCDRPRIAVLSLNPHAGDDGLLGEEEKNIIIPALCKLQQHGYLAFGPYPADGLFGSGEWKKFDGILAMYHDQGLAPFKTIAGSTGVNFTAGLDFIRTSPDHGTAYDIAGSMTADASSMREAIYKALDIYKARERYEEMTENPLKIKKK